MKRDELNIIRQSLTSIKYKECLLFGSQARGEQNSDSDYDILIIIDETISQKEKFAIIETVHNRIAPYLIPVDL